MKTKIHKYKGEEKVKSRTGNYNNTRQQNRRQAKVLETGREEELPKRKKK